MVWPQIIGLRNILVHMYDRIDLDKVWQVITEDLQPLVDYLEPLLPPEDE